MTRSRSDRPRLVVALGADALLRPVELLDVQGEHDPFTGAARALSELSRDWRLVVTHGSAPNVGSLGLHRDSAAGNWPGVDDAQTRGGPLEQALARALPRVRTVTLLMQTLVDPRDTAFTAPTQPIGPPFDQAMARRLASERGWSVARQAGRWRRMVASPEPRAIAEAATIELLMESDAIVLCSGGGGVPVVRDAAGNLHGVDAVVDRDLAAAVLAIQLEADGMVLLTDVDDAEEQWGTEEARAIRTIGAGAAREMAWAKSTMGPKIEAACRFVEHGGPWATIGAMLDAPAAVAGTTGTTVLPGDAPATYWEGRS